MRISLAVVLALVAWAGYIDARCESLLPGDGFGGTRGSVCAPFVDYEIYVPDGHCQADIEQNAMPGVPNPLVTGSDSANNTINSLWPTLWGAIDDATCRLAAARYMCASLYPPCSNPEARPCRSLCFEMRTACGPAAGALALLEAAGQLAVATQAQCNAELNEEAGCLSGPVVPVTDADDVVFPRCEVYPGGVCAGVIDSLVYVPQGLSMAALESSARVAGAAFGLVSATCQAAMLDYVCANAFRKCQYYEHLIYGALPLNVTLPSSPCFSVCQNFNNSCGELWTDPVTGAINTAFRLYPNCFSANRGQGSFKSCAGGQVEAPQPDFPATQTFFRVGVPDPPPPAMPVPGANVIVPVACEDYADTPSPLARAAAVTCVAPTVLADDVNSPSIVIPGGFCGTPCPLFTFSETEYNRADTISGILCAASFIITLWMAVTWYIFEQKRGQKKVFYFLCTVCFLSIIFLSYSFQLLEGKHIAEVGCRTNTDLYETEDGGFCVYSGAALIWAVFFAESWWLVSAGDLYIKVVWLYRPVPGSPRDQWQERGYLIFAFLFPTVCVVPLFLLGQIGGADGGVGWCFVHGRGDDFGLQWAFFYYPLAIGIAVGFFCMISIVVKLIRGAQKTGTNVGKGWWKKYLRALSFMLTYLVLFSFVFFFRASIWFKDAEYTKVATDFVRCKLQLETQGLAQCGDEPASRISPWLWYLIHVSVAGQGIFSFFTYGMMEENFRLWAQLLGTKLPFLFPCWKPSAFEMREELVDDTIADSTANPVDLDLSGDF